MTLSVNVSARTMGQPGFDDFVLEVVREHHLAPDSLKLELTETSLLPGGSAAQDTMRRLAAFGIQTGVDDFGTGYSALSYLHDLPVGFIKVDRAFVSRLDGSPQASAVVRSVVEPGPRARLPGDRRGRRDPPAGRHPARDGVRPRPGLAVRAPGSHDRAARRRPGADASLTATPARLRWGA
ncbi:hypothetical protein GCM10025868_26980 [Angustibacter aerolatus]|uniref:EAL domain-containing protein n=1 Tax=Angustibacter aerolatus TaxID=1162965 RepID=A0ABQ6JGY1_9ACTN|nr:EAL domain-containing protein [Angustibacter aerolatus]GMA87448.1 hypothetical protein GCM10025868_26980 [Angustibacter aerolatus]